MTKRTPTAAELQTMLDRTLDLAGTAAANRIAQSALDQPDGSDAKWLDASLANLQRGFRDIVIAKLRKLGVLERLLTPAPQLRERHVEFIREDGKLRAKVIEMPRARAGR